MELSLYGKTPGELKEYIDYIDSCSEMELFILVRKYYEVIRTSENILKEKSKKITLYNTNYQEFLYSLDYSLLATNRFGTNIQYNPNGRIKLTNEFKKWYDSWQSYENNLDDNTRELYYTYRRQCKSLELFSLDKQLTSKDIDIIEEKRETSYYQPIIKSIKQATA